MRVHYLQHVPFENLGSIADKLISLGHEITSTQLYEPHTLPALSEFDWLIIMGGPMGIYDEEDYPYLVEEKRLLKNAIEQGKIVLGICLGAQLIADTLGARVYAGKHKEIGWFQVDRDLAAANTFIGSAIPESIEAFHWHGDTFDLPEGAVHLASSAACKSQAFVYGDRVVALQYHLETTRESAAALIEHCSDELVDGPCIQSADAMLENADRFVNVNSAMASLLDRLAQVSC